MSIVWFSLSPALVSLGTLAMAEETLPKASEAAPAVAEVVISEIAAPHPAATEGASEEVGVLESGHVYTKEALDASLKLLEINPVYGWNFRKIPEAIGSLIDEELRVVEIALRKNPKSYRAWHHRKWVLRLGLVPVNFDREFSLIQKLLAVDSRNFHGWNYRRFVAALKDVSKEEL